MKHLLNKVMIYLLCSYFYIVYEGISMRSISLLLVPLIISCLCSYAQYPVILTLFFWTYSLSSLWIPELRFFLPVLIYDAALQHNKLTPLPILLCSLLTCICLPVITFPFLVILAVSFCLSVYSSYVDELYRDLHHIRDESKEKTLALHQRNQALIEKQNADIHAATLSERNRIAREIHDNVGHMLTRSILQVGALKIVNHNADLQQPIEDLQKTLNTAMTSVRTSVHDLHDDAIDLYSSICELTQAVTSPTIKLDYDMGERIPKEVKYAFIAIVKEAINNIQKHSNATSAQIQLREHPGFFLLHIADNGNNMKHTRSNGIGLSNMEERIRALGGTIRFYTDNGFRISIMIRRS